MKHKQVKYIDSYSDELLHDQYNASFLATCCAAYGRVEYFVGKSSYTNTKKLLDKLPNLKYKVNLITVCSGKTRFSLLLRTFISALQNIRFLLFSNRNELLIFNFNNFMALYFLNSINKWLKRDVIIVCHSELAFIEMECVHTNFVYRYRTWILRHVFKNKKTTLAPKLQFCVLGESILKNLSKQIPANKLKQFFSVDHPYIFSESLVKSADKANSVSASVRIGVIGTMAQEKGADILISIANGLVLKTRKDVSIEIIGKILCDTNQFEEVGVILPPNKGRISLPRETFNAMVNDLDYILYLYPVNSYRYTASGSIMDAINYEKPILSFRNDYFDYLFNKFGAVGYLAEDIQELTLKINSLINARQHKLCFDFKKFKQELNPISCSNQLVNL